MVRITGGMAGRDDQHLHGKTFVLQFASFRRDREDSAKLSRTPKLKDGYKQADDGTVYKVEDGVRTETVPPDVAATLWGSRIYMDFHVVAAVEGESAYDFSCFGESLPYSLWLKGVVVLGPESVEFQNQGNMLAALLVQSQKCGVDVASLSPQSPAADPDYLAQEIEVLSRLLTEEGRPVTVDDAIFHLLEPKLSQAADEGSLVIGKTWPESSFLRWNAFSALPKTRADSIWQQYRAYQQTAPSPEPVAPVSNVVGQPDAKSLVRQAYADGRISVTQIKDAADKVASNKEKMEMADAISAGTPILDVLTASALRKVAQELGLFSPPSDPDAITI